MSLNMHSEPAETMPGTTMRIPTEVADRIERGTPRCSSYDALIRWIRKGELRMEVAHCAEDSLRTTPGGSCPATWMVDVDTWDACAREPIRLASALVGWFVQRILGRRDPVSSALAARRTAQLQHGVGPSEALAELLAKDDLNALAAHLVSAPEDLDRVDLAVGFRALRRAVGRGASLDNPTAVQAWVRAMLEYDGATLYEVHRALMARRDEGLANQDAIDEAGFYWQCDAYEEGRTLWVPSTVRVARRTPTRSWSDVLRAVLALPPGSVVGFAGAAAAGKSTAVTALLRDLTQSARRTAHVAGDSLTLPGHGFRYTQHETYRDTHFFGPIYDVPRILRAADAPDADLVVVDAVYLGRDAVARARTDLLIGVERDDQSRLDAKWHRDHVLGGRAIDVPTDFAAKTFHESHDAIEPVLATRVDARIACTDVPRRA